MKFHVKGKKHHKPVIFTKRAMSEKQFFPSSTTDSSSLDPRLGQQTQQPGFIIEDLSQLDSEPYQEESSNYSNLRTPSIMSAATARASMIPDMFKTLPPLRDLLNTQTSQAQEQTIQECLPFLCGEKLETVYNDHGVPHLEKKRHIAFLHKCLKRLPAPYVAADASRPWMFYWALAGLSAMGENVSQYQERLISTVRPIQNPSGGFGGGNGQMSHLAPTYATLLSLAIVGGDEALSVIDRKAMWKWLGALKQPDGGFLLSVGGEEDVRYDMRHEIHGHMVIWADSI